MALIPFSSKLIADTGISTGDEGKGRIIIELINEIRTFEDNDDAVGAVMKVNGGSNSGHTVAGLKLNLLPGGVADPWVPYLTIGCGVVADPRKFLWEIAYAELHGHVAKRRLRIDERTLVSDLSHRLLDLAWEDYRVDTLKETSRGSTGRGITPAYLDEVGQWQIYYDDFRGEKEFFARKLRMRATRALQIIQSVCGINRERWDTYFSRLSLAEERANKDIIEAGLLPREHFDFSCFNASEGDRIGMDIERLIDSYWAAGQVLIECICDVRELTLQALESNKYVIGEFGQAYWLDKRHGFPPNVTASHTFTPEFFQSAGIPVQPIHTVGCCKAYDTKVGTHVFISEIEQGHPLREHLSQLEFGSTTGRQRMVGWFDAVEKGDALRYGGYQDLALNKLDALSYQGAWQQGELLICTAYEAPDGSRLTHVPRNDNLRRQLKPVFTRCPGWSEDISSIRHFKDLPQNAQNYVKAMLRAIVNAAFDGNLQNANLPNLRYLGVGPEPDQIIKDIPATREMLELL